jgi:stage III sporulation protein AE
MKKTLISVIFIIMLPLTGLNTLAYGGETEESIADSVGTDKLESVYLTESERNGDETVNIFEKVILITVDSIKANGKGSISSFGAVIAVIILCSVLNSMKFGGSETVDAAMSYISVLALSGLTYSILYNLFIFVIAAMESLTLVMSSFIPITAALYSLGGNPASGAASSSALSLFLNILSILCTKVILPLLRTSFALALTGAMPSGINLSAVSNFVKSLTTTLLAFIFTLLGFVLYFQTAVASASDTFFTRSVKFASGVFVPVIGGMLGDAAKTVLSSVSVVKGTVGSAGVVIILAVVIPPIIAVTLNKIMLLFCSVLSKTLGCERESALLYDLGSILNVLLALVCGSGAVCLIAIAVFVKTGGS